MIYLDHAASSPMRPSALDAYAAAAREPGNAASAHTAGRRAAARVEAARKQVAALIGRTPGEVVFTAGGTEADNLAVLGAAAALEAAGRPRRALRSAIEHSAVRGPFEALVERGWEVGVLPVDADGLLAPATLAAALPGASLVSVMAVNNEMGAVQDLAALAALVRGAGAVFHVDAVQGAAWLAAIDADLVAISAHKLGGPQGVGALFVRRGTPLLPVLRGGAHERGRRPGTLAVAAIAGFGAAAAEALGEREAEAARLCALRDALASRVLAEVSGAHRLGRVVAPHILAFAFPGVVGEALVEQLDLAGVCASTGAACTVLGTESSPVLPALGLDEASVQGSLRLSLGWSTTAAEVAEAAAIVAATAARLATMKPMAT